MPSCASQSIRSPDPPPRARTPLALSLAIPPHGTRTDRPHLCITIRRPPSREPHRQPGTVGLTSSVRPARSLRAHLLHSGDHVSDVRRHDDAAGNPRRGFPAAFSAVEDQGIYTSGVDTAPDSHRHGHRHPVRFAPPVHRHGTVTHGGRVAVRGGQMAVLGRCLWRWPPKGRRTRTGVATGTGSSVSTGVRTAVGTGALGYPADAPAGQRGWVSALRRVTPLPGTGRAPTRDQKPGRQARRSGDLISRTASGRHSAGALL